MTPTAARLPDDRRIVCCRRHCTGEWALTRLQRIQIANFADEKICLGRRYDGDGGEIADMPLPSKKS